MSLLENLIALPLVGAALALGMRNPGKIIRWISVFMLLLTAWLIYEQQGRGAGAVLYPTQRLILSNPPVSFSLGADGLSLIMSLLTALVTLSSIWQVEEGRETARREYAATMLMSAAAFGAFLSRDVMAMYAFHELALIPTLLMIALHGRGEPAERQRVAWKTTLYLGIGSLILLVGLVWLLTSLAPAAGGLVTDLDGLAKLATTHPLSPALQGRIAFVLLLGFGTLVSLFPLHTWAASAYSTAPVPVAMMHSAVLKKFGIYGLLRLLPSVLPLGLAQVWVSETLLWMLLGNILFVGWVCIHQKHLDELIANSSVMHMGYLFLGLAAGTPVAANGVVLLMFAHGISVALLFALSGKLRAQLGTLELRRLGGLGSHAPRFFVLFAVGCFASIGLPGLANFAGELMIFVGTFTQFGTYDFSSTQWAAVGALWGVVISAIYMLRALRSVFHGTARSGLFLADPPLSQRWPLGMLAAVLLVVGCCPWLLLKSLPAAGKATPKAVTPSASSKPAH